MNAEYVKRWKHRWENACKQNLASNIYGPSIQSISLLGASCQTLFESVGVNTFIPKILHRQKDGTVQLKSDWMDFMQQSNKILKPCIVTKSEPKLLCEDDLAKSLAREHKVDIVMTSKSLEALFRNPDLPSGLWTVPLSFVDVGIDGLRNLVVFMEDVLPTVSTPRECLSVGIEEALIGHFVGNDIDDDDDYIQGCNTYTLLKIPTPSKRLKVLIRSRNYLTDEKERPVVLLSQLEYFLDRGMEEFTVYDRVLWLLHKIIQDDSRIIVARVNVNATSIVRLEEKTVADALIMNETNMSEMYLDSLGPFDEVDTSNIYSLFYVISTILSATQLIEKAIDRQYVICRESAGNVICRSSGTKGNGIFSVSKEMDEKGTAVLLNPHILQSCFKRWQLKENIFPFTFSTKG